MAKKTCKGLTYAPYAAGGDGTAVTYSAGKAKLDYLCQVQINESRSDEKEYADGHQIDSDNSLSSVALVLELANNDADLKKELLGHVAGTGDALIVTDADAPFVGLGFILCNRHKGVETYEGYWFYKVQCSSAGITSSTKRDTANWEHENINGSCSGVIVESGGRARYYEHLDGQATEALVRTWLNAKAGISP